MINEKPRTAGQVLLIPTDQIYPNPNQPRQVFDQEELVNLAISIRMNGILQPITVRQTDKGYELVSGERRLRASKLAGLVSIPCIVVEVNNMKSAVFYKKEDLRIEDLPIPEIKNSDDVLIRVRACGICGKLESVFHNPFSFGIG